MSSHAMAWVLHSVQVAPIGTGHVVDRFRLPSRVTWVLHQESHGMAGQRALHRASPVMALANTERVKSGHLNHSEHSQDCIEQRRTRDTSHK